MLKKILAAILALVCATAIFVSCDDNKPTDPVILPTPEGQPPAETDEAKATLDLLEKFKFDATTYSGYEFEQTQTVDEKETNSYSAVLILAAGGTKGSKIEKLRSLNPDPFGEDYVEETIVYLFDGSEVKKNGVVTTEYTAEGIKKLDVFDVSIMRNALQNVSFSAAENTLSFTVTGIYVYTILGNASGVDSVNVSVKVDSSLSKILGISFNYTKANVKASVSLTLT